MKFNRTALRWVCVAAAMIGAARGQTQIDLRTQGKNIDFSSAARTRPSKTGTSVPSVCTIGETFVKTDAAGARTYTFARRPTYGRYRAWRCRMPQEKQTRY